MHKNQEISKKHFIIILVLLIILIALVLNIYLISSTKRKIVRIKENLSSIVEEANVIVKDNNSTLVFEVKDKHQEENQKEIQDELIQEPQNNNINMNQENDDIDLIVGILRIPKIRSKYRNI